MKRDGGDPSNYRPISLLNTEVKVWEKLLIQRIMHYAYTTETLNKNQYGFTSLNNTVDVAMEVRQYTEPHLNRGVVIIISLDVQRVFGSAWWPAILQRLRDKMLQKTLLLSKRLTEREKRDHDRTTPGQRKP
jgi:hypothetical protein